MHSGHSIQALIIGSLTKGTLDTFLPHLEHFKKNSLDFFGKDTPLKFLSFGDIDTPYKMLAMFYFLIFIQYLYCI